MIRFTYKRFAVGLVTLSIALCSTRVTVQVPEGGSPYTPSKIEWLCVELNAAAAEEFTEDRGFSMAFTYSGADPNTVIIFVRHLPTVHRNVMNAAIDGARQLIELKAKQRRWSWVKLREQSTVIVGYGRQ